MSDDSKTHRGVTPQKEHGRGTERGSADGITRLIKKRETTSEKDGGSEKGGGDSSGRSGNK